MLKIRKFFFFILLFLLISPFVFAATDTEIQYPTIPGAPTPTATTTFPEYVKYLFNFSIIIVGLIVFAVLIWAGILYLTSTGDPAKAQEAKSKATGAFLGLLILLLSYLILTTINPQLTGLPLEPVPPLSGIYLISNDAPPKKTFVGGSNTSISFKNADKVEFITATSSLMEVYLYDGANYTGIRERITASSTLIILSGREIKSIYFLWNRPGIYLYQDINFNIGAFGRPLYLTAGEINDLSPFDFNDKASSLKFVKGAGSGYGTVLFTNPLFRGQCGFVSSHCGFIPAVFPDLSTSTAICAVQGGNMYAHPIGTSTLSSLKTFTMATAATTYGIVYFYDRIDCQGDIRSFVVDNALTMRRGENLTVSGCQLDGVVCNSVFPPLCHCYFYDAFSAATTTPLDGNIKSFKINRIGSGLKVIISSGPELSGDGCEVLPETNNDKSNTCYTLKNGYSYNTDPDDLIHKVHSFLIFPVEEF